MADYSSNDWWGDIISGWSIDSCGDGHVSHRGFKRSNTCLLKSDGSQGNNFDNPCLSLFDSEVWSKFGWSFVWTNYVYLVWLFGCKWTAGRLNFHKRRQSRHGVPQHKVDDPISPAGEVDFPDVDLVGVVF